MTTGNCKVGSLIRHEEMSIGARIMNEINLPDIKWLLPDSLGVLIMKFARLVQSSGRITKLATWTGPKLKGSIGSQKGRIPIAQRPPEATGVIKLLRRGLNSEQWS